MRILMVLLIMISNNLSIFSQDINWDAELRFRGELDNRDFRNSTPPNYYTLSRVRLGLNIKPTENIFVYLQLQDSRVFGEEKDANGKFNTINNLKNVDLHQGFIQIDHFLLKNLSVKIGRQRMFYGNERMIAPVMWNNIGRSFDGGLVRYGDDKNKIDLFVMNTGETNISPTAATPSEVAFHRDAGQLFSGIYFSTKYFDNQQLDAFLLHQFNRKVSIPGYWDLWRYTSGVYGRGSVNDFFYEVDIALQFGTAKDKNIFSNFIAITGGYKFKDFPISSASVSFERLSGTSADDKKVKTFDLPYPSGHKFFGFMDYFINIPLDTENRGLMDIYARLIFRLNESINLNLTLHNFNLAEELSGKKDLGNEIDIVIDWKYNKFVSFEGGYSAFLPGKVLNQKFVGYDVAHWAYLSTMFNF